MALRRTILTHLHHGMDAALRFGGPGWLIRRAMGRRHVAILAWHDVAPELFDAQLAWLGRHAHVLPLDTLAEALHSGDWSDVPPRSVVLTFDDGVRGNARLVETLRRRRAPVTFYLTSDVVASQHHFWWTHTDPKDQAHLFRLPHAERIREIERRSGWRPDRDYPDRQALSIDELRELGEVADLQAHTRTHPVLPTCDEGTLRDEVAGSKARLEELLGRPVRHLAYPNGDYTDREVAALREAGFRSGRTIDWGWNGPGTDPYRLRILGLDPPSVDALAALLTGVPLRLARARRGWLDGRVPTNIPSSPGS